MVQERKTPTQKDIEKLAEELHKIATDPKVLEEVEEFHKKINIIPVEDLLK